MTATMTHPRWCDRDDCQQRREHRSRALPANPAGHELISVQAVLVELLDAPGRVVIGLVWIDGRDRDEWLIELAQGAALARQLRRLLDARSRS